MTKELRLSMAETPSFLQESPQMAQSFLSPELTTNEFFTQATAEVCLNPLKVNLKVFKNHSATAAAKLMHDELSRLTSQLPQGPERDCFQAEMQNFYVLFTRYLADKVKGVPLDWDKIQKPKPEQIKFYADLKPCDSSREKQFLSKLAVLKLNGGLGTTMGCVGPKSVIEVRDGLSFLDLTVRQIEHKNNTWGTSVPLILMNSFNTDEETKAIIKKYEGSNVNILTFNQSRFPRIYKDSLVPVSKDPSHDGPKTHWYPPGHGDLYQSLVSSGLLDRLLAEGKEYLFVSNVDNLGATVDTSILQHFIESNAEFLMEVTEKTKADVKGGTIIDYEGNARLLEIAQVPPEHVEDFKSIKKFKIFNTNNMWISLRAIKRVVEKQELDCEIIVNVKTEEKTGEKVIQLETAAGKFSELILF
jgi:UTP--glucose-1-phosphate uridylyltransferase